jgi:hypothetical protein
MLYEVCNDTECPRCGNTRNNRDAGPYEYIPELDDALGGVPDPKVHLIWCGACFKPFDVAPQEMVAAYWDRAKANYADGCPRCEVSPPLLPSVIGEVLGTIRARYECPSGHKWVALYGRKIGAAPLHRISA